MTVSKGIMAFIREEYGRIYAPTPVKPFGGRYFINLYKGLLITTLTTLTSNEQSKSTLCRKEVALP
jgi:hypothetical protein